MRVITLTILMSFTGCWILSGCSLNKISRLDDLKPDVLINYVYYGISGVTKEDLRNQMNQLGPSDEWRVQHDAYTNWYVDWSYPNSETNGNCATGSIAVTVTITHTFPKWNIPPDASQELIKKWNAYLEALQTHEAGHRQIGVDASHEILRTLNELPAYSSCAELEQVADRLGQNIVDEARQKEVYYDQTTVHGKSQGAWFP